MAVLENLLHAISIVIVALITVELWNRRLWLACNIAKYNTIYPFMDRIIGQIRTNKLFAALLVSCISLILSVQGVTSKEYQGIAQIRLPST